MAAEIVQDQHMPTRSSQFPKAVINPNNNQSYLVKDAVQEAALLASPEFQVAEDQPAESVSRRGRKPKEEVIED